MKISKGLLYIFLFTLLYTSVIGSAVLSLQPAFSRSNPRIEIVSNNPSETGTVSLEIASLLDELPQSLKAKLSSLTESELTATNIESALSQSTSIDNIESIIGGDDRSQITTTTNYPWNTICKIYFTHPGGGTGTGTGFLVDDFHILTAGHCVYLHDELGWSYDSWADEMWIIPAMDEGYAPYTKAKMATMWSSSAWVNSHNTNYDWGLVRLDRNIGDYLGWMNRWALSSSDPIYTGTVNSAGYPGDLDQGLNMYFDADLGTAANGTLHWYTCDTAGGQSGMPIWHYTGSERYVLTIHTYGNDGSGSNHGTRLSTSLNTTINNLLNSDAGNRPSDLPDLVDRGQRYSLQWDAIDPNYGNRYGYFSPTTVPPSSTAFTVQTHISNWGSVASGSFDVTFYASTNTIISAADFEIGTVTVGSIAAYGSTTATWSGTFPAGLSSGNYYIGWIIDSDDDVTELDETNNNGVYTTTQMTKSTDNLDPTNPTSYGSSPTVNVWTTDNTIYVSWSGAADGSGSGVAGYGLFWSNYPTGLPSAVIDTTNTYTTSSALADGIWYLHIRTADNAGNWADTEYSVGPFKIDTTDPSNPSSFTSNPTYNIWSNDNTIFVEWLGASDGTGSGIAGYGIYWSTTPAGIPSQVIDTVDPNTTSSALTDGDSWYLHIITVDAVGNWNTTVFHIGPFKIDTVVPTWDQTPTDQFVVWNVSFSYDLNATDALSGISNWAVNDTTNFSISSQGVITSIGTLAAGTYGLEVTVIDEAGNSISASFSVEKEAEPTTETTPIPGFPLGAIILGLISAMGIGVLARRQNIRRKH
jgi:glutamyl endopeptidase